MQSPEWPYAQPQSSWPVCLLSGGYKGQPTSVSLNSQTNWSCHYGSSIQCRWMPCLPSDVCQQRHHFCALCTHKLCTPDCTMCGWAHATLTICLCSTFRFTIFTIKSVWLHGMNWFLCLAVLERFILIEMKH